MLICKTLRIAKFGPCKTSLISIMNMPPKSFRHVGRCLPWLLYLHRPRLTFALDHPRQDEFSEAQEQQTSPEEYARHLAHLRRAATVNGIDRILDEYGLDVIIGPADSFITSFATGSGTFKVTTVCSSRWIDS